MKAGVPFRQHLQELAETVEKCSALLPSLEGAAEVLCRCLRSGNKVLACGNGGSAADCQHWAAEMLKGSLSTHADIDREPRREPIETAQQLQALALCERLIEFKGEEPLGETGGAWVT